MTPRKPTGSARKSPALKIPIKDQVSAGGVVYRGDPGKIEVVIVAVGGNNRWQLPKGLVDEKEKPEVTAVREVREEGGARLAEATIHQPDFGIRPYQAALGGLRVKPDVQVRVSVTEA